MLRSFALQSAVPIIVLTARDGEVDCVLGLELGADDCVTMPFSMAELVSRVRALLRRRELERVGPRGRSRGRRRRLDPPCTRSSWTSAPCYLTPSQFKLLALLAETPGRVVSRREILQRLWDSGYVGDDHVCDVHISNLRHKIERDPPAAANRHGPGSGYKLVAG